MGSTYENSSVKVRGWNVRYDEATAPGLLDKYAPALNKLRDALTIGRVYDPIDLGHEACRELGIEPPRIAVTGLNPHAGEDGVLGHEEQEIIAPAVREAQAMGLDVVGPLCAERW